MKYPIVGQRVKIAHKDFPEWDGIFLITKVYKDKKTKGIEIYHPIFGAGGFYPDSYTLIPLTKLEKALK